MSPLRLVLLALFWTSLAQAEQAPWIQGNLSARVLEAGYTRDTKSGAWEAEVLLRLRDLSATRRFNQALEIEFVDAQGAVVGNWKSFVSLSPGVAQHRRVRAPSKLGCVGELSHCPPLALRLAVKKPLGAAFAIPASALEESGLPPAGSPLYVSRVLDGDTFQLLDGQRVRLLGVDAPEQKGKDGRAEPFAREATELLAQRVMDDPVTLAYDGTKRDPYGRVVALVYAKDGSCLNLELLNKGLAKLYHRSDFGRKAEFTAAEAAAQAAGLGLWKDKNP